MLTIRSALSYAQSLTNVPAPSIVFRSSTIRPRASYPQAAAPRPVVAAPPPPPAARVPDGVAVPAAPHTPQPVERVVRVARRRRKRRNDFNQAAPDVAAADGRAAEGIGGGGC